MYTLSYRNNIEISNHRSLAAAARAQAKHLAAVRRANGADAYLDYVVLCDGRPLTEDEYDAFMDALIAAQE